MKERTRQLTMETNRAWTSKKPMRLWRYECVDGELFEAIAQTEAGAFCVLNAERPGMMARFLECKLVPCPIPFS